MRRLILIHIGLALALGILTALIGPFGTFTDLTFAERLIYWISISLLGTLQVRSVLEILRRWPLIRAWSVAAIGTIAALLASVPITLEVQWLELIFRNRSFVDVIEWARLYGYVVVLTLGITIPTSVIGWTLGTMRRSNVGGAVSDLTPPLSERLATSRFFEKIPSPLGRELLALKQEDHYLRIYTKLGSDLILHRLSDAVEELASVDGLRVHRSWWVARDAIARTARVNKRTALHLINELTVPISRTYLPQVRGAGWLQ